MCGFVETIESDGGVRVKDGCEGGEGRCSSGGQDRGRVGESCFEQCAEVRGFVVNCEESQM